MAIWAAGRQLLTQPGHALGVDQGADPADPILEKLLELVLLLLLGAAAAG